MCLVMCCVSCCQALQGGFSHSVNVLSFSSKPDEMAMDMCTYICRCYRVSAQFEVVQGSHRGRASHCERPVQGALLQGEQLLGEGDCSDHIC